MEKKSEMGAAEPSPGTASLDLDVIEARANAASPAPWQICLGSGLHQCTAIMSEPLVGPNTMVCDLLPDWILNGEEEGHYARKNHIPDLKFIEAAREDVPALVAEVRVLRASHSSLRKALAEAERTLFFACNFLGAVIGDDTDADRMAAIRKIYDAGAAARAALSEAGGT